MMDNEITQIGNLKVCLVTEQVKLRPFRPLEVCSIFHWER